ncbi:2-oxoglutarate dehydrogenase complex dihydrolipoyllysine-residue succinyltransferase [Edaphosphingomonas haloaromaticamans]|uniref:Dihydrolipoyllysine-residue succinyltransferase component of 2-oxoglutarate dehydrogenase complex n=1 Tax=Edaphosphingomonas haloaromaticamans TaxID=653954 RepID=A0A1S1HIE9_9SPHN|nr:2-oxoglutarate dehydrogenase complex dihydrolipoyllysine-residue succinyltransferase [Sphingomonas haloaromaticamans]OHT20993.1 Dihydrolipoyllysine-residue succinyltransferase component of 2-oxoglutarate dehydrogenase complex [Sphingomonas haloaromaticamans]
MATEVKVPTLGESITEATLGQWLKAPGEAVKADEPIASLETDKVAVEVNSPVDGVMGEQVVAEGDTVLVDAVIAIINEGAAASTAATPAVADRNAVGQAEAAAPAEPASAPVEEDDGDPKTLSPAVRRVVLEYGLDPSKIKGTGKDGRLTKDDVLLAAKTQKPAAAPAAATPAPAVSAPAASFAVSGERKEERVRMTRLRKTVAARLKDAQNTAAMLTTYNDVDMTAVIDARNRYKDLFEKKHGIRLGFMSFFAKAAVLAARDVPAVNASIEGDEIVYRDYVDISVAVSAPQGLVVPVVRDADKLSFAGIEKTIADFGRRAKDGTLKMEEMKGGTFTISNGGVFGSLLSSPIINPPQSAVLGLHRIEERPVVRDGQIVARPMMYLALSYDHRLIDGREAVTFLVRIKEAIEDPTRLLIDL